MTAGLACPDEKAVESRQGGVAEDRYAPIAMSREPAAFEAEDEYFIFAAPEEQGTVDKFTGTFRLHLADLFVPAGMTGLELARSYREAALSPGTLGSRWCLNWESSLLRDANGTRVVDAKGVTEFRQVDGEPSILRSLSGEQLTLRDGNALRLCVDGTEEAFLPNGKLAERRARHSTFSLRYDPTGRLDRVDGPEGTSLVFTYAADGTIRVKSSSGDTVTYTLRQGRLSHVERADGVPIDYTYDATGRLTKIRHPQFGSVELTYNAEGLLSSRRWSDGSVEQIDRPATGTIRHMAPDGGLTVTEFDPPARVATITDPAGRRNVLHFDRGGRIDEVTDPQGKSIQFAHDENGRLLGVTGAEAGPLLFQYRGDAREPSGAVGPGEIGYGVKHDSAGRISQVQGGPGASTSFQYDDRGRPTRIEASHAPPLFLAYDKEGRVQSITDAAGQVMQFERDSRGRVSGIVDFAGARSSRKFDDLGRVTSATDAAGATTRYEYSPAGMLHAVVDPNGATTRFEYHGRSVTTTDPLGNTSVTWHDPQGRIERTEDANGAEHRYEYDPAGNLVRELDESGGQTRYDYDRRGQLVAVTAPDGNRTSYRYDDSGKLLETSDLLGQRVVYEYDENGLLQKTIAADGTQILWEVGPLGLRERSLISPVGPAARLGYDAHGNLVSVMEGDRTVMSRRYDKLDRLTEESNDRGLTVRYSYDAIGNLVGRNDSLGRAETTAYDPVGRPVVNSGGLQGETRLAYDLAGNLIETKDSLGHATRFSYDAVGQLAGVTCPSGRVAAYQYDPAGRLSAARIGQHTILQVERDSAGNPLRLKDALGRVTELRYDTAGRVVSRTDAAGRTVSYVYSSSGILLEKRLPEGRTVTYLYDARGNVTSVDDKVFPVRYTYDDQNRITRIEYPAIRRTLVRRYDPTSGRLAEFIDSEGRQFSYRYDDAGRLTGIEAADQGMFTLQYDAADRLVEMKYPNGVVGRWAYGGSDRLVAVAYQDKKGVVLEGVSCDYDKAGRPVLKRMVSDEVHYSYDADDRLVEERREGGAAIQYEYGETGARSAVVRDGKKTDIASDAAGQLSSAGAARFEHDANGNLTARIENGLTTRYLYDVENRLVEVKLPDNKSVSFGYAATGERVWREDEKGRIYYVTDGLHVWAELDADLKPASLYAHGPMIDRPLMMTRGGQAFFFHADELGSVTAISDNSGKLARSYRYDAFGNSRDTRKASIDSPFRFTGREWDPDTHLYYFRSRYYDPQLGRFLSVDTRPVDPSSFTTLEAYAYADGSPTMRTDPLGTQPRIGDMQRLLDSTLSSESWGSATYNPLLEDLGKTSGADWIIERNRGIRVEIGPSAVNAGREQILATRFHEAQHEMQAIHGRWSRVGMTPGAPLEMEAHARTAEFTVRKGFSSELTEQYISKYESYGGNAAELRNRLQSMGYRGAGRGGIEFGTPVQAAHAATRTASIAGLALIPANLYANWNENQSGWALAEESAVYVAGAAVFSYLTPTLGTLAAANPVSAAVVTVGLTAYGFYTTSERLGESVVAEEIRQAQRRQEQVIAGILEGDYVNKLAAKLAELEAKKKTADTLTMAVQAYEATIAGYASAAEASRTAIRGLVPQQDPASALGQLDALREDANVLADECERLAAEVESLLASGATGAGPIIDSPQVEALVYQCDGLVGTISGHVNSCRGKNSAIVQTLGRVDRQGARLAEAEAHMARIDSASTGADALVQSIRQGVDAIRGLQGEVRQGAGVLQHQIEVLLNQLAGVQTPEATLISHDLSRNLAQRVQALLGDSLPIAENLTTDAVAQGDKIRLARIDALASLDAIRNAVPAEVETADDALARAEAAHQRALAALLAFLSRIRSSEEKTPAELAEESGNLSDLANMTRQTPGTETELPDDSLQLLAQEAGPVRQPGRVPDGYSGEDITVDAIQAMLPPEPTPPEPTPPIPPEPTPPPPPQRTAGYEPVSVEGGLTGSLQNEMSARANQAGGGVAVQVNGSRIRLTINERADTGISQGQVDCQLAERGFSIREITTITFQPRVLSTVPGTMVPNRVEGKCSFQSRGTAFGVSNSQGGTGTFTAVRQADNSWLVTVNLSRRRDEGWLVYSVAWLLK